MSQIEVVANTANELLFVGALYKRPDLFVEYGHNIRSKYDFNDEATRFFYDQFEVIYTKRTQDLTKNAVNSYMIEEPNRMESYKRYGGFRTIEKWMSLSISDDADGYFTVLKKFSLLREYQRNGFDISKIMAHPKFEVLSASDIYRLIRAKADKIHTVILTNEEAEILNDGIQDTLLNCMETPDLGLQMPFPIMNDMVRGMKQQSVMAVGMLSNAGKTRYMVKLIAYIALVMKQKVFVLLNEMTVKELKYALITTVINNPEFQSIHGYTVSKKEKELTLGQYKDDYGEIIAPIKDEWGEVIESTEDFAKRVAGRSKEFVNIMKIAKWIESETEGLIFVKDVSTAYDDRTLEFEIRKAHITNNVQYFFYDTFKNDLSTIGDWAAMKATATKLTELAKQLNMFGYLSIQLTDDAVYLKADELTSNNISNCKAIKHVLHTLFLLKEIKKSDIQKYHYKSVKDWGTAQERNLDPNKRYYVCNTDKNRFGDKKKLIFEVDLDKNIWTEIGVLAK